MIDIDKVANRLNHYKHLKNILEAHETRTASIALRRNGMINRSIITI